MAVLKVNYGGAKAPSAQLRRDIAAVIAKELGKRMLDTPERLAEATGLDVDVARSLLHRVDGQSVHWEHIETLMDRLDIFIFVFVPVPASLGPKIY